MRRINNSLNSVGINTLSDVQHFPYSELKDSPTGNKYFVRFVDATSGSDENNGASLGFAKASLTSAVGSLPNDLQQYPVVIFIAGGTYEAESIDGIYNGQLYIVQINPSLDDTVNGIGDFPHLYSNSKGESSFSPTWDPVVFKDSSNVQSAVLKISISNKASPIDLLVQFDARDFSLDWDENDCYVDDGFQFIGNTDDNALEYLISVSNGPQIVFETPIKLDLGNTTSAGFYSQWNTDKNPASQVTFKYLNVFGGNGDASTSNGSWKACFLGHRSNFYFNNAPRGTGGGTVGKFRGAADYASSKSLRWTGVHNFCFIWDLVANGSLIFEIPSSQIEVNQGNLASTPEMNIKVQNGNIVDFIYDGSVFSDQIVKDAIAQYTIEDTDSNTVWKKSAEGVELAEGNSTLTASDTPTSDASLANGQVSLSLDETGNNLIAKVKYSDGTVKTATVAFDA